MDPELQTSLIEDFKNLIMSELDLFESLEDSEDQKDTEDQEDDQ